VGEGAGVDLAAVAPGRDEAGGGLGDVEADQRRRLVEPEDPRRDPTGQRRLGDRIDRRVGAAGRIVADPTAGRERERQREPSHGPAV
jgi:hypothetical protein